MKGFLRVKWFYALVLAASVFFTSCSSIAGNYLLVHQFQPGDTGLYAATESDIEWRKEMKSQGVLEEEYITADDGASLRALNLVRKEEKINKSESPVVILSVHGWSKGAYTQLFKYGRLFYENLNVNFFAPDLRNSGKSDGIVNGWGVHDKDDLLLWVNKVIDIYGPDCVIYLHGLSLGGTAVLYLAAEELPPNVVGVISDAAVASVRDVSMHHLKNITHNEQKSEQFFDKMQEWFYQFDTSYDLNTISLYESLGKIKLPVLFIYSASDEFVPAWTHKKICDSKTSGEKEIWVLPKCSHDQIVVRFPKEYVEHVRDFIE